MTEKSLLEETTFDGKKIIHEWCGNEIWFQYWEKDDQETGVWICTYCGRVFEGKDENSLKLREAR